jgi:DNA-binding beta-propeller fold protein YncE
MLLVNVLLAAALLGSAAPLYAADAPLLSPQTPIAVPGGPGGFDYMQIDPIKHRLLASHPGKTTLVVLDLTTNTVQQLPTDTKINGIAVDAADNKLFTAGGGGKLVVFDNTTLAKTAEITLTGPGDDIVLDTKTDTLYVCHDDAMEDWVFNARDNSLIGLVPVAGAPEYVMYDPGTDRLYQNIKPANVLQVINPTTNKVEASWPTAPMTSPHGMGIDFKAHHILSAGQGKAVMLDETTGKVLSSVDIAPGYVDQIAFDQSSSRLYCACGTAGAVSVIQENGDNLSLLGTVVTHPKSHTLAVDPATHAVWISYTGDTGSYLQEWVPSK